MFVILVSTVLAMFAAFCALDHLHRSRRFPAARYWRLKGVAAFAAYLGVAFFAPYLWDAAIAEFQLVNAANLPLWVQIIGGLLVAEAGIYAWHRALHANPVLWRHFHQTHHAAERVDIWGAFWFHPLDMVGFTFVSSLCLVGLFGVAAEAAVAISLITTFLAMFSHANIRTPHWLGWFISRPEMHGAHHERGVHRDNYADLPVFDMIFGTYRNPPTWSGEAGFFDGASGRWRELLIGREVA